MHRIQSNAVVRALTDATTRNDPGDIDFTCTRLGKAADDLAPNLPARNVSGIEGF